MKFVSRKIIKGGQYYYLQYRGYSKFIGLDLPSTTDILKFFREIAHFEYESLPNKFKNTFKYADLKRLEELHYDYVCHDNELFSNIKSALMANFINLFTYHSNKQEGSKTTKKEIEKFAGSRIRKPKTKTARELMNSFDAYQYAISTDMKWNIKHIKHIHELLLREIDPLIAGKWKNENNVAPGDQMTSSYKDVGDKMKNLINWLNDQFKNGDMYPPELAIRFYCKFEAIHPFSDGNGRVGRILLNAIMEKYKYSHVIFFSENAEEHNSAIKAAREGRWDKMLKHFSKQIAKTDEAFKPKK